MPWRGHLRKTCKLCGGPRRDDEFFTKRGNHRDCSLTVMETEVRQLRYHSGPYFEHWRRQMAACVGGVLLDEAQSER